MGIKGDRAVWEAEDGGLQLLGSTIGEIFDRQAAALPDKEALVYNYPELGLVLRLSYAQYQAQVNQVAKGLIKLGVEAGEHVAVWSPNLPQWVFLQLALAKIGAVLVTVNPLYKAHEAEYVLRQGDIAYLFMAEEVRGYSYLEAMYQLAPELKELDDPANQILQSNNLPRLKKVVLINEKSHPGLMTFGQMVGQGVSLADEVLQKRQASVSPDDVAVIMYTSGTTGFPKGAMLTHSNLVNTLHILTNGRDRSSERVVSPMPLFHIAGLNNVIAAIYWGATLIQMLAFDPTKQLELLSSEKGTATFSVPTMLIALLNHPRFQAGEFDLSSLRLISTGAAAVPVTVMEQIKEKMGADVTILFGQTESAGAATVTPEEDAFEIKARTVGKTYPHTDLKIINPHSGEVLGFGEVGELLVRGFMVMKGYYNMPEKTAETIDNENWLHTGDLATMDEKGYVRIVGRLKEMIIRGGENIYPVEIENFLMRHPKIAEAQVIGVPDPVMGEEMVALLILKQGESADEDEVREYLKANLSRYKVPKYIQFVQAFPMTASGKVKKFEVRAQLIQQLGLQEAAKA